VYSKTATFIIVGVYLSSIGHKNAFVIGLALQATGQLMLAFSCVAFNDDMLFLIVACTFRLVGGVGDAMYIVSSLATITIEAKGNREEAQSKYAIYYVMGNLLAFVTAGIVSYITGLITTVFVLSLIGFSYSLFSFFYIPKEYN